MDLDEGKRCKIVVKDKPQKRELISENVDVCLRNGVDLVQGRAVRIS